MIDFNKQIEHLELAASDASMLAGLHWDRASREESWRQALALRKEAQRVRGERSGLAA